MIPSSAVQELSERLQQYYAAYQQKEAEVLQLHDVIRQMTEQLTVTGQHITQLQAQQNPTEDTLHPVSPPEQGQSQQAQPLTTPAGVSEGETQQSSAVAHNEPIQAENTQPLSQDVRSLRDS